MSRRGLCFVFAVSGLLAAAAPVRHAGEWEVSVNNQPPRIACFPQDETLDQATLARKMAKIPGATCNTLNIASVGNVTTFSSQCAFQGGGTITTSATITQTGPDAYTSTTHSSGGSMKLPDGRSFSIPAADITTESHRIGPCKPGDHQIAP